MNCDTTMAIANVRATKPGMSVAGRRLPSSRSSFGSSPMTTIPYQVVIERRASRRGHGPAARVVRDVDAHAADEDPLNPRKTRGRRYRRCRCPRCAHGGSRTRRTPGAAGLPPTPWTVFPIAATSTPFWSRMPTRVVGRRRESADVEDLVTLDGRALPPRPAWRSRCRRRRSPGSCCGGSGWRSPPCATEMACPRMRPTRLPRTWSGRCLRGECCAGLSTIASPTSPPPAAPAGPSAYHLPRRR